MHRCNCNMCAKCYGGAGRLGAFNYLHADDWVNLDILTYVCIRIYVYIHFNVDLFMQISYVVQTCTTVFDWYLTKVSHVNVQHFVRIIVIGVVNDELFLLQVHVSPVAGSKHF